MVRPAPCVQCREATCGGPICKIPQVDSDDDNNSNNVDDSKRSGSKTERNGVCAAAAAPAPAANLTAAAGSAETPQPVHVAPARQPPPPRNMCDESRAPRGRSPAQLAANRPRFKPKLALAQREEDEDDEETRLANRTSATFRTLTSSTWPLGGSPSEGLSPAAPQVRARKRATTRRRRPTPGLLILALGVLLSSISAAVCDHSPSSAAAAPVSPLSAAKLEPPDHQRDIKRYKRRNHRHYLQQHHHQHHQHQLRSHEQAHLLGRRRRRKSVPQAEAPGQLVAAAAADLKVAAAASKLEHWLACSRLAAAAAASSPAPLVAVQQQEPPQLGFAEVADADRRRGENKHAAASCAAHFDGHVCWPPTAAGAEVRVACPKLINWTRRRDEHLQQRPVVIGAVSQTTLTATTAPTNQQRAGDSRAPSLPTGNATSSGAALAVRRCDGPRAATAGGRNLTWPPSGAEWSLAGPNYEACGTPSGFDPTDSWLKLDDELDGRLFAKLAEQLERIEASIEPYNDPDLLEQWTDCIGLVMRPPLRPAAAAAAKEEEAGGHCPAIFDGWRCWPATRAGETAYVSCPANQPGFSAERKAHKICTPAADWYRHPLTNRYWSNYTTCVDTVDLAFRTKILNLYVIGNLISLIALSISLIIFISFKSLNCTRVTIHKNLFLSFITNNLMWIIWYTYVVNDANLLQSNPVECRVWHVLLHYFLVSNYFWMFCEGLYLHTLLVVAFVSENKILKWFYLLGWLTPVPITLAYAYNRSYDDYYTNFCWMEESPHNIILMAPIGISLLLNLVFLINIVRVLVTKLRANNSPDTHQTRKAVRATLILIPLLGLHYMLTPFRPDAKSDWEMIYEIIAAVCTSFQGLCVAMLFCFCNGEVISAIRKRLKDTCLWRKCAGARQLQSSLKSQRSRSNTAAFGSASLVSSAEANCRQQHHFGFGSVEGTTAQTTPLPSSATSSGNGTTTRQALAGSQLPISTAAVAAPPRRHLNGSNGSSVLTNVTVSSAEFACDQHEPQLPQQQQPAFRLQAEPVKQQISLDDDEDSKSNSETIGLLQRTGNLPTAAAGDEAARDAASPLQLSSAA